MKKVLSITIALFMFSSVNLYAADNIETNESHILETIDFGETEITMKLMTDGEVEDFLENVIKTNENMKLNGMIAFKHLEAGKYTKIYSNNNILGTDYIKLAYPSGDSDYVNMILYAGENYYSAKVPKGTIANSGLKNGAFDGRLEVFANPSSTGIHNFKIFDF